MNKIIAIAGPAGSGKGTLAKALAKKFNLVKRKEREQIYDFDNKSIHSIKSIPLISTVLSLKIFNFVYDR